MFCSLFERIKLSIIDLDHFAFQRVRYRNVQRFSGAERILASGTVHHVGQHAKISDFARLALMSWCLSYSKHRLLDNSCLGAKPVGNGKDFQHHEFVMLWFRCLSELPGVEILSFHVGVSKNRDTPKWMVYNGKPY